MNRSVPYEVMSSNLNLVL
jgi:adenosine deaminase